MELDKVTVVAVNYLYLKGYFILELFMNNKIIRSCN